MYLYIFIFINNILAAQLEKSSSAIVKVKHEPIQDIINVTNKVKITFMGNKPFELMLYTTTGVPLHYKGIKVSYIGFPLYYHINNIGVGTNKVSMTIQEVEWDLFKYIITVISICSIIILITFKREHKSSQFALVILLSIEIYRTSDYDRISDRIIHKILF